MESRSEHTPPEQQPWQAQYYTPQPPVTPAQTEAAAHAAFGAATGTALCAQVREQLQSLLENDGTVRPETATALYVHLAVCAECAREFGAMQRVVNMLEAMPLAELPTDYSRLVMHRIQTGQGSSGARTAVQAAALCDRVREKLQPLLDNDLSIQPEMATALYGHLAVCTECAAEFASMRRMLNMLETMASPELPIDYAPHIMQRIQAGDFATSMEAERRVAPGPTFAASLPVSEEVATIERRRVVESVSAIRSAETRQTFWQRVIGSVALSGLFITLLASDWGRQMLGVDLETARLWLSQVGEHLEQVPVLGALIVSLSAALASMDDALSHSFTALGSMAGQTLAIELSIGLAAWLVLSSRRRVRISGY